MNKKRKGKKSKKIKKYFKKEINIGGVTKKENKEEFIEKQKNKIREKKISFLPQAKNYYKKIIFILKKRISAFFSIMICRTNARRDAVIISLAIILAIIFLLIGQYLENIKSELKLKEEKLNNQKITEESFELENINEIKSIQSQINLEDWKNYQSSWYGFKIKYPSNWETPIVQPYSRFSSAVYRVSFLSNYDKNKEGLILGFDVAIYDMSKTKELFQTDEFPQLKDHSLRESVQCKNIEGHFLETGDYPAEEIYIPVTDNCYNAALFFSVVSGQYIYNISPKMKDGAVFEKDLMVGVSDELPEFFAAVSSFENIEIIRPKSRVVVPKITAPMPATYGIDRFGRLVCEKKNDKPSKSDKNKKKHLDMECCLDPDEYPNPHCYYDPSKYGKYLK